MVHSGWIIFTSYEAEVTLNIPELTVTAQISVPFQVTIKKSKYNVNFGRD